MLGEMGRPRTPTTAVIFRSDERCENEFYCTGHEAIQQCQEAIVVFTSASSRCLDPGDVDLFHRHHGLEGALCLGATSGKRIG